VVAPVSLWRS